MTDALRADEFLLLSPKVNLCGLKHTIWVAALTKLQGETMKIVEFSLHVTHEGSEMGFDGMVLKSVLESFVDDIAEESSELILERPRFAYAVVVIADDNEMCEASCVRQLDVEVFQTQNSVVEQDYYDSKIERALRELTESRDSLSAADEGGKPNGDPTSILQDNTTNHLISDLNLSPNVIKRSGVQFPSMARPRK